MLMLVVTIIIAAVVSSFAGGIGSTTSKAPTLSMDVTIKNTGIAKTSYILFDVKSTSEAIPSKDLKIITTWSSTNGNQGGNTTAAGLNFPNTITGTDEKDRYQAPLGFGRGVTIIGTTQNTSTPYDPSQMFGNYSLTTGTTMKNSAWYTTTTNGYGYGTSPYSYPESYTTGGYIDGMQAILGGNWNATRPGDYVSINIFHIPSGKVIFTKDVAVTG
jgi:FlaG/FlaF family flagellin (archaellin)